MTEAALLVTGASGHLGRRALELLLGRGAKRIIAATRTPDTLADFAARGVEVRRADFDDPASLKSAFASADRLLLISTDAVGQQGRRLNQHRNAIQAAEAVGVRHVVYTSLVNPVDTPVTLAPDHAGTEAALEASPLGWTVLRNSIYAEGLVDAVRRAAESGIWASAVGAGRCAYVTREDCAQAAAAALAGSFERRRTLDITGPAALSGEDLARIAGSLSGKPVQFTPLPASVLLGYMVGAGLPQPFAELLASFDDGIAQGRFSSVSTAVADLTGRPPISVETFLASQRGISA
ncbi:MAG: SDR family oxidoreductase [Anaerolineae bacterium]|nr:SDR family oxidoreductase [Anaerolineae bacterium]